jgi:prefoldin subunit 5
MHPRVRAVTDAFVAVGRGLKPVKEDLTQLKMRTETISRQLDELNTQMAEVRQGLLDIERVVRKMIERVG